MDNRDNFVDALVEYSNKIYNSQQEQISFMKENEKIFEEIEVQLDKVQGKERSNAYNLYKAFAITSSPISITMSNNIINEMTAEEKKLLFGK